MALSKMTVEDQVKDHIHRTYLKSADIEQPDSIDFCDYFVGNFGTKPKDLKNKFLKIEADLKRAGWTPQEHIQIVVAENPDDIPEFWAAPWQLGFTDAHSVKGKSKLVNVLDTVGNFLKKPYNSKNEPLQMIFCPGSTVGGPVADFSMIHSIGMGKSSAARMILLAVSEMALSPADIKVLGPKLKALLRMRCTYDPAATEEEQLEKALEGKNKATERPRPCPLSMASKWEQIIQKQGLHFASVIDAKIAKFNSNKDGGYGVLDHEIDFIKAYPHQAKEFKVLLESHWQNFKLQESAVPPKRFSFQDLSPDTKPKRCEKNNVLFMKIFSWSAPANVFWLMREVGVFLRAIKDAQRANKKVNLRTNAKAFRKAHSETSHDEICVFVHFMPDFKVHTTEAQWTDLCGRLCKGYLDKELAEKAKAQDPKLTVHDFRCLSMVTGKNLAVQGPRSTELTIDQRAESILVEQFKEKLKDEVELFVKFRRQLQVWQADTRKEKREHNETQEKNIEKTADSFCSLYAPVSKLSEDRVIPYICDSISNWCEKIELSKDNVWICFIVRFDALGQKYHTNLQAMARILSDFISNNPVKASAVVIAPNTGKDNVYNEVAIEEAIQEVDEHLRQDTYNFRVRRASIDLDEESLGPRSNRPGFCQCWRVQSSKRRADDHKKYESEFEGSYFFRRGKTEKKVPVLAAADYVNPCAPLVRQSQGASGLHKAARSKQWHTGLGFWDGFTGSVVQGLNLRMHDGMAWVDMCGLDDKLLQSVILAFSRRSATSPAQMVITPLFANMGHTGSGDEAVEKVDNARVEAWMKKTSRKFTESRIRDKTLRFPELPIVDAAHVPLQSSPVLDHSKFVKTCPNAAGFLPVRQDIIDELESKVQGPEYLQSIKDIIKDHDKKHNPSEVPFKGETKRPAPESQDEDQARRAKEYPAEPDGPKSYDEFQQDEIIGGNAGDHELMAKDGRLWAYAKDDCILPDNKPLAKFWGEYLCGSENKKIIAKNKNANYMWEVDSYDFEGAFGYVKNKSVEEFKDYRPSKLSDFMAYLEEKGKAKVSLECHDIKEIKTSSVDGPPVQGVEEVRYEIKSTEDCLFLAKPVPAKNKPSKANAASTMDFSQWDFPKRIHKLGRVKLVMTMHYDEEANSIIPVKPMLYLTHPIKMKKGTWVLLG